MSIREDFDKAIDDAREHVEDLEEKFDEKKIARERREIEKEDRREVEHDSKLDKNLEGKQDFFKKAEEKFERMEDRHDQDVIKRKEAEISGEYRKIDEHESKFYDAEADLDKAEADKK